MNICAVIPSAGYGSRLNAGIPKLLLPITTQKTVWSLLREKLLPIVDHINIIASPLNEKAIRDAVNQDITEGVVSISIQQQPIGMGDAIFCGNPFWSKATVIVVVWGDQVAVSSDTLKRSVDAHAGNEKTISLPLIKTANPYVEYIFNDNRVLVDVKQSREGDLCSMMGLSDVGTFVLSVDTLMMEWERYLQQIKKGKNTQEINFLPFLPFLSLNKWNVHSISVTDPIEARGINTPDDLLYFKMRYSSQGEML